MYLRFLIIIALVTSVFFLLNPDGDQVVILSAQGRSVVDVELADDNEERRIGLMGRTELAEGEGMLFVYDQPLYPVMWMKDMLISLDILFIDSEMIINHIEENIAPCTEEDTALCPRYRSDSEVLMVLELPAGYAKKHGIEVGDYIESSL